MITISCNTTGLYTCSIRRRTTCDRCGKRRVCATTWIGTKMVYIGRTSRQSLDAGDLCAECRGKLEKEV